MVGEVLVVLVLVEEEINLEVQSKICDSNTRIHGCQYFNIVCFRYTLTFLLGYNLCAVTVGHLSSLRKCLSRSTTHFNWLFNIFFLLGCINFLYILNINLLSVKCLQISYAILKADFSFCWLFFCCAELFSLMQVLLNNFLLLLGTFVSELKLHCQDQCRVAYSLVFP